MKFIGQYIQSFIARFRSDVYLEDIDTGTIASGGNLGLDSNNKIVKAIETSGDITSVSLTSDSGTINGLTGAVNFTVAGGTGISTSATGSTLTINETAEKKTKSDIDALTGVTENNLGTFTGSTISDSRDIKEALQDLETKVEVDAAASTKGIVELATTAEADTGTDTARAVTPAGLKSHVDSRYSTSYITFSAKSTSSYGTNYIMIHANGISESTFSVDSGVDSAGDFGGVTTEEGGSGTDATISVVSSNLEQQIPIPETCKLVGFYATTSTSTNTGAAYDTGVAIFHVPESEVDWGGSNNSTATLIHKSDSSRHSENTSHSGTNRKKPQRVSRMDGTAKSLAAGDIIIPSIFGETGNQQIMATITLVIATPIKTIA